MDPDTVLTWILRSSEALDAALEAADPPDPDAVYTLVGLVRELDEWLREGRAPPARWRDAFARDAAPHAPVLLDTPASNDAPRLTPSRRRARVRARRSSDANAQLALPLSEARRA